MKKNVNYEKHNNEIRKFIITCRARKAMSLADAAKISEFSIDEVANFELDPMRVPLCDLHKYLTAIDSNMAPYLCLVTTGFSASGFESITPPPLH